MPVELQLADELQPAPDISSELFLNALATLQGVVTDERLAGVVCVRICEALESQQLNAAYRGQHKPTNVLSFPADVQVPGEAAVLGDLAICWPVVVTEAKHQGKPVLDHLTHLFVHGVLHLLGFDHEQEQPAQRMEKLEVEILAALQIADPYTVN